jgi:hypothetical protein
MTGRRRPDEPRPARDQFRHAEGFSCDYDCKHDGLEVKSLWQKQLKIEVSFHCSGSAPPANAQTESRSSTAFTARQNGHWQVARHVTESNVDCLNERPLIGPTILKSDSWQCSTILLKV